MDRIAGRFQLESVAGGRARQRRRDRLCAAMPADIPSRRWSTIAMTAWTPSGAVFHR
jgi:hypothetical protein